MLAMSSLLARGAPPVGCPQLHIHCHPHLPHEDSSNILLSFAPIPFPGMPKYRQNRCVQLWLHKTAQLWQCHG